MKLPARVSSKYAESISVWICSLAHRLLVEQGGVGTVGGLGGWAADAKKQGM